ncbi:MAG TPA: YihY/virulence factor BrkB family protein [Solirubrobacteraceae bacterium]|jgi:inner membrane protein YhjD|nr:YihY/virulence factor BrkB family protein [Solirubrobacteraceae bacterium]
MDLLAPIRKFDRFQQKHKALAVPAATIKKFSDDSASTYAVTIAFYAFFSVFPLLLVALTILGYLLAGDPSLLHSVRDSVLGNFPVIGDSIENDKLKGHALGLVVGVVLLLWSSLGVTSAVNNALDHVWGIPREERANFFKKKLRGLVLLASLGSLFVIASGVSGIVSGGLGGPALKIFGIIVSILVNVGLFLAAFHFLCSDPPGWHSLLPGTIAAAILWEVLQVLGGVYIDHIKNSSSAYGTFALVLGILAWIHLGSQITVYCAELNSVLVGKHWPRPLLVDSPDPAKSESPAPASGS